VAPREDYSRADVRRKFGLTEQQLKSWERQNLIAVAATYTFSDLLTIKTLIRLRENRVPVREIARALHSLREKLREVKQPLAELRVLLDGKRITVHVAGQKMEAVSGQILFDFDAAEIGAVKDFPQRKRNHVMRVRESEAWFQKGLELEETGAPVEEAVDAYRKVLDLNPGAAGALVNLGTIYYRLRKFGEAEKYYRDAVEADPEYALAEFNLGNLYDEQGRMKEAFEHYRRALALNPQYADAHFNLALLCERLGDPLKAVHHWKTYLKLDHSGQWAEIARRQLERLRQAVLR
jgi:Tfp pilus assembly protein PilF/DNA-binding transcriptional MerR regulator